MHKHYDVLDRGLRTLKLEASEAQKAALLVYADEIERWNKRMNLVRSSGEAIITAHILDSLAGVSYLEGFAHVADLGSGAGLPGIPLAIMTPNCQWSLVERGTARAAFLANVLGSLALAPRVRVCCQDANKPVAGVKALTCRAFLPLSVVLPLIEPYLVAGIPLFAYQGKVEETEIELARYRMSGELPAGYEFVATKLPLISPWTEAERWIWKLELRPEGASSKAGEVEDGE